MRNGSVNWISRSLCRGVGRVELLRHHLQAIAMMSAITSRSASCRKALAKQWCVLPDLFESQRPRTRGDASLDMPEDAGRQDPPKHAILTNGVD